MSTFFSTTKNKITDEEVVMIENLVNEKIATNTPTKTEIMKLDDAKKSGAHHQFDEKYEDDVRVVTLYNSVELCGGTHVKNVGDIKKFAIIENIKTKIYLMCTIIFQFPYRKMLNIFTKTEFVA